MGLNLWKYTGKQIFFPGKIEKESKESDQENGSESLCALGLD